jgi:Serine dehydrogenase proteinase
MRLIDLFWLFLIFSALQPFIRLKWLEASRLRLLKRSEQKRGSIAIALVHRQETISLLGIPLMRSIDIHDKEPKDIDHQTLILADVARKAPVSMGTPPEIYQLMHLFSQRTRMRPTVASIPLPRRQEQDQHGA